MDSSQAANPLLTATETATELPGLPALAPPSTGPATAGAESTVSTGSRLDAIRAKKAAGQPLTRAEAGFLGGMSRKSAGKLPPLASAPGGATLDVPAPARSDNPLFSMEGPAGAPSPALAPPAADTALIRATADALLSSVDTVTKLYVGYEAKQAGDDDKTIDDFKAAVALQPGNRALMVDNSEPVILKLCEVFKCSPEKLKSTLQGSGFFAGAVAHTMGVIAAVKTIRQRGTPAPAAGGGK